MIAYTYTRRRNRYTPKFSAGSCGCHDDAKPPRAEKGPSKECERDFGPFTCTPYIEEGRIIIVIVQSVLRLFLLFVVLLLWCCDFDDFRRHVSKKSSGVSLKRDARERHLEMEIVYLLLLRTSEKKQIKWIYIWGKCFPLKFSGNLENLEYFWRYVLLLSSFIIYLFLVASNNRMTIHVPFSR